MPINVTATLHRAMQSLRSERNRIDGQIRAVQTALGISTNSHTGSNGHRPTSSRRRRMSPAARRALSKRMKAYWAARRRQKGAVKPKKS
jgi:hypothetical protein